MKKSFVIIYYENFCGKKRKKYILSNLLKMCLEGHATADTSIYDLPFKQLILSIKWMEQQSIISFNFIDS